MRVNCKHVAAVLLRLKGGGEQPEPPIAASAIASFRLKCVRPRRRLPPRYQLPLEIDLWLDRAERTTKPKAGRTDYAPNVLQRLLYVLRLPDPSSGGSAQVQLIVARKLKAGGYSGAAPWTNARQAVHQPSSFVLAEDQRILRMLLLDATRPYDDSFVLNGETGTQIMRAMLASGRCHASNLAQPLVEGAPRQGNLRWQFLADGLQQISGDTEPPCHRLVPLAPPWYLDLSAPNRGPLETSLPSSLAEALAGVPGEARTCSGVPLRAMFRLPEVEIPRQRCPLYRGFGTRRRFPPAVDSRRAYGCGYRPLSHFVDVAVLSLTMPERARGPQQPTQGADLQ
jgi:hypothetical protein